MRRDIELYLSRTDKLCLLGLVGILVAVTLIYELTDGRALRASAMEADEPMVEVVATAPAIDFTPLFEAVEAMQEDRYREDIPLDRELQAVLREVCEANDIPYCLALGLIEVESGFDPEAINGVCYGLMQLNTRYFPVGLSYDGNIRAGVAYLAEQIERYDGDIQAALTAYNAGHDTGSRTYARKVLDASVEWEDG